MDEGDGEVEEGDDGMKVMGRLKKVTKGMKVMGKCLKTEKVGVLKLGFKL